jgi:hypothetical protein
VSDEEHTALPNEGVKSPLVSARSYVQWHVADQETELLRRLLSLE